MLGAEKRKQGAEKTGCREEKTGCREEKTGCREEKTGCREEKTGCREEKTGCREEKTGCREEKTGCREEKTGCREEKTGCREEKTGCRENRVQRVEKRDCTLGPPQQADQSGKGENVRTYLINVVMVVNMRPWSVTPHKMRKLPMCSFTNLFLFKIQEGLLTNKKYTFMSLLG